jgi:small GTP-binding protein
MIDLDSPKKVILLGNSGVGKTSLFHRWITNTFRPSPSPTIGAAHTIKSVDLEKRIVNIDLWDTAGQEQFHAITPLYIRGSSCAVIVTEPTPESFESLNRWTEMITETIGGPIGTVLAVNKSDLRDPWEDAQLCRRMEGFRKAFSGVFAVSAKTGINVDLLFAEAVTIANQAGGVGKTDCVRVEESKCC